MADLTSTTPEIGESVALTNLKILGDVPGFYTGLAMGNAVQNQQLASQAAIQFAQAMGAVLISTTGAITNTMTSLDPTQAASETRVIQDLASKLADLQSAVAGGFAQFGAAIAAIQQLTKSAQTTPPVTPPTPGP